MQPNFTTMEQSALLVSLGLPKDSADSIGFVSDTPIHNMAGNVVSNIRIQQLLEGDTYTDVENPKDGGRWVDKPFPAWSVVRLMEIIDICDKEDSSGDTGEEYPSTTKVRKKLNMTYVEYLVRSIERAIQHGTIDLSKLQEALYGLRATEGAGQGDA